MGLRTYKESEDVEVGDVIAPRASITERPFATCAVAEVSPNGLYVRVVRPHVGVSGAYGGITPLLATSWVPVVAVRELWSVFDNDDGRKECWQ